MNNLTYSLCVCVQLDLFDDDDENNPLLKTPYAPLLDTEDAQVRCPLALTKCVVGVRAVVQNNVNGAVWTWLT